MGERGDSAKETFAKIVIKTIGRDLKDFLQDVKKLDELDKEVEDMRESMSLKHLRRLARRYVRLIHEIESEKGDIVKAYHSYIKFVKDEGQKIPNILYTMAAVPLLVFGILEYLKNKNLGINENNIVNFYNEYVKPEGIRNINNINSLKNFLNGLKDNVDGLKNNQEMKKALQKANIELTKQGFIEIKFDNVNDASNFFMNIENCKLDKFYWITRENGTVLFKENLLRKAVKMRIALESFLREKQVIEPKHHNEYLNKAFQIVGVTISTKLELKNVIKEFWKGLSNKLGELKKELKELEKMEKFEEDIEHKGLDVVLKLLKEINFFFVLTDLLDLYGSLVMSDLLADVLEILVAQVQTGEKLNNKKKEEIKELANILLDQLKIGTLLGAREAKFDLYSNAGFQKILNKLEFKTYNAIFRSLRTYITRLIGDLAGKNQGGGGQGGGTTGP